MTRALLILLTGLFADLCCAGDYQFYQESRPDLFDADTGLRSARYRAPTPSDIPAPARVASPLRATRLMGRGAIFIDVYGAAQSAYDPLNGEWLVAHPRNSLPGAIWLPETGRGTLTPQIARYLSDALTEATDGNQNHPIVVFCIADCWMSWNAAQRVSKLGYQEVWWFRLGTDGWADMGHSLSPVRPKPLNLD